ncbi:hypothetical protein M569_17496 [Genlisea aurea]|uniref:Integrase catalytic domain-containing protein n=1 Tax=Genlisea aurea TaxID=192259 RepID=S8BYT8_9LAMI|nr:hypothetical protein M569_17496 [Genlisea aurea]
MVAGLPENLDFSNTSLECPACLSGKMTRVPYPRKGVKSDESIKDMNVGDEVCSDTFGPIQGMSRYGNRFIVEFIDKASSFAFLFGLSTLSQVFTKYIVMWNILNTQLGVKIKLFRADGHGCYDNSEMRSFLAKDGTLFKMRTPYCLEQNAIAERRVRTIVEMARTMLIHSCVPSYCWEDAVMHANHVKNRIITRVLNNVTPYEKFWKKKPDLQWLRPFGCLAYVLIHKELRQGKFEAVARPGVLMGMSDAHSGYKIHMLQNNEIKIARDVWFYEEVFPYRKNPTNDLQWMNPLDCPKPEDDERVPDGFEDPFVKSRENTNETRRISELSNLYKEKVFQINNTLLKITSSVSSVISDEPAVVTEGVEKLESTNFGEEVICSGKQDVYDFSQKDIIKDCMVDGVILNVAELDLKSELEGSDREKWLEAFRVEYGAILRTKTFVPMTLEARRLLHEGKIKVHQTRPILVHKFDEAGNIARYKVRLVVKGFTMEQGIDYDKTFAPCARMNTVRMIVAWAVALKWQVIHADVPNAYLNGKTPHLVVIKLPPMWNEVLGDVVGKDGQPAIMANSLYGAPDAGRNWNSTYVQIFIEEGYTQCKKEPCLFVKGSYPRVAIFVIWVDDTFATGSDVPEIDWMMSRLKDKLNIKKAFIEKIAQRFGLSDAKPLNLPVQKGFRPLKNMCPVNEEDREEMRRIPYRSAVGSLLYVALCTRPDIMYATCALARFGHNPGKAHWTGVKSIIRYLMASRDMCFNYWFPSSELSVVDLVPNGFSDAAFNDADDGRSTMGYVLYMAGYPISWRSKVAKTVAQSSFEAEWVALNGFAREVVWARDVFAHIFGPCKISSTLRIDNQACFIHVEQRVTEANKHFKPKFFLMVQLVRDQIVTVVKINSTENCADIMTKALGKPSFGAHRRLLMIDV